MLCSVCRVCNVFECIISFAGSYTEALNDAKIAVELQPSFLKAFVRGKLTLHIPSRTFFPEEIQPVRDHEYLKTFLASTDGLSFNIKNIDQFTVAFVVQMHFCN